MIDVLVVELTKRTDAIVWQPPSRKPVRGPTSILNGEPTEELVLQRRKREADLFGSWQGSAVFEAGQVRVTRRVIAARRELPTETVRHICAGRSSLYPRPEMQELHDSINRQSTRDVKDPGVVLPPLQHRAGPNQAWTHKL
jgi:hypothetical protein